MKVSQARMNFKGTFFMDLSELIKILSPARFRPYLRQTANHLQAVAAYEENLLFCTRYFVAVHFLEVVLRNEINGILGNGIGPDWFVHDNALNHPHDRQLADALERLKKQGKRSPSPDDIVARLLLGFWVGILRADYEKEQQYWRKYLHKGFCHRPAKFDRKKLFNRYDDIRHFRNRVFHHDRILHLDPARKLSECLEAIGWINPAAQCWAEDILKQLP